MQIDAIGGDDVTPRATIRRAESAMKGQKTKNSSNKNRERTSIAGAIVKLLEKQESGEMLECLLTCLQT